MGLEKGTEARPWLESAVAVDPQCQKAQAGLGVVLAQSQEFGLSIPPLEAAMRLEPMDEASLLMLVDSYTWTAYWKNIRKNNPRVRQIFVNESLGINPAQPSMELVNPDNDTPTIDFHYPFVDLKEPRALTFLDINLRTVTLTLTLNLRCI